MKITFKEFCSFLSRDGYKDGEIRHLFNAIRSMDSESRSWVIWWFAADRLPTKEIQGVTAEYLIKECGYKPLNALIILDWLKTDPQAAKYFLLKMSASISPSDSIGQEMEQVLQAEGVEPTRLGADVDASDIQE